MDPSPQQVQHLGIQTDLKAKSLAFLRQHFGKSAEWYRHREQ
jgi:hypothetical protein